MVKTNISVKIFQKQDILQYRGLDYASVRELFYTDLKTYCYEES